MSAEIAAAELHYTDLGDAETFDGLRRRHGLERVCGTCATEWGGQAARKHAWKSPDTGVVLFTDCDPTETTFEKGRERAPGYCSYTTIRGPSAAAESLFRDVVESATHIKGEFVPLTTESGDVVVSLDDARPEPESEPGADDDDGPDFEPLFAWLRLPSRQSAYDHVAVSIPGSDAATLRESDFETIPALPSGATYGSGVSR